MTHRERLGIGSPLPSPHYGEFRGASRGPSDVPEGLGVLGRYLSGIEVVVAPREGLHLESLRLLAVEAGARVEDDVLCRDGLDGSGVPEVVRVVFGVVADAEHLDLHHRVVLDRMDLHALAGDDVEGVGLVGTVDLDDFHGSTLSLQEGTLHSVEGGLHIVDRDGDGLDVIGISHRRDDPLELSEEVPTDFHGEGLEGELGQLGYTCFVRNLHDYHSWFLGLLDRFSRRSRWGPPLRARIISRTSMFRGFLGLRRSMDLIYPFRCELYIVQQQ